MKKHTLISSNDPYILSYTDEANAPMAMQSPSHHHTRARSADPDSSSAWASRLLLDCAKAIADNDSGKIHHLLWVLNELSSPYGDLEQKIASSFLQALFCKATDSGRRCHKVLSLAAEKSRSFDAARKVMLEFQELSPYMTFGHVACNGAIVDAVQGEANIHIIDFGNNCCTQWPTLLEALASRSDDMPSVHLTAVAVAPTNGMVIKEAGKRMERFAKLMGVPFKFRAVSGLARLSELREVELRTGEDEAVVVSCSGALRRIEPSKRSSFLMMLASLEPKLVTVVEEEADFTYNCDDFMGCFCECLRFYTLVFEMLNESFSTTSNERLALERECSRSIVRVLACEGNNDGGGDCERREKGRQWCQRLRHVLSPVPFSEDTTGDVAALLKRHTGEWSVSEEEGDGEGIYLKWKDEPLVWASAWRP